ncbi:zinc finger domain-containing protein [Sulfuracidifex tepidarius]|jgi:predicted RNA-binding Zn-ribbon protein involved in translation (DUF1610 family)|uniref:Small zinc finger protein HVO-2753-like zinc-binding pocket domain-containing protein n=1 Tax=Sulfuracidifex tepidarius TaxID=1294262 RepID=A0A510E495_9CREN|nr:zinc finger domain-containing protein [Sulfuracidifex tepidarius]BBG24555.1 hypothetical protein IC006_1880 [Sulfuracidifex tepidarius]BBG27343.1 hypothetical protein IC007_1888 [Sulfuracidifex tepidarius]
MSSIKLSIRDEVEPLVCSSCGKLLHPKERGVEFTCPNCGEVTIIRDYLCREQTVEYTCPKCGFKGP